MIRLKNDDVSLTGLRPELLAGVLILASGWPADADMVVTSANDGRHSPTSLHYAGAAVDVRSKNLTPLQKRETLERARLALRQDFDLLLEAEGTDNEHFHLEWQPERDQ